MDNEIDDDPGWRARRGLRQDGYPVGSKDVVESDPGRREREPEFEGPYLILGFWKLAIIGTLMVAFFPFSLLFCVVVFGLEETKLLCKVLLHDALKTFIGVLAVAAVLVVGFLLLLMIFR